MSTYLLNFSVVRIIYICMVKQV